MDAELYDEFGNYLGPELDDSDEDVSEEEEEEEEEEERGTAEGPEGPQVRVNCMWVVCSRERTGERATRASGRNFVLLRALPCSGVACA